MLVVVLAMTAIAAIHTVADDFSSGDYSGSTGNATWERDWVEIGDSGAANDPNDGQVRVEDNGGCVVDPCLTLSRPLLLGLGNVGASRAVDLTEATSATLRYHLDLFGALLTQFLVQASVGSDSPQTLTPVPGANGQFTVALPVGDVVTIRFITSGLSLGASAAVDDVEIQVTSPDPTTTSTSSTTTSSTASSSSTTTSTSSTSTTTTLPSSPREDGDNGSSTGGGTYQTPTRGEESGTQSDQGIPFDVPGVSPPSRNHGVVTDLTPRLGGIGGLQVEARADLLVDFSTDVEEISLDLLASAVLGFMFAVLWSRRLGEPDAAIG
jgi:hypothetical protein